MIADFHGALHPQEEILKSGAVNPLPAPLAGPAASATTLFFQAFPV